MTTKRFLSRPIFLMITKVEPLPHASRGRLVGGLEGPRGEQMRQLGNAVPVELGAVIGRAIVKALG